MHAVTAIVLAITAALNIGIAVAGLATVEVVLVNSAEIEVPESWLPRLAVLKGAGGIGLLLWFVRPPAPPTLAAAGLVCFFIGAITTRVRARVLYNIAFPGVYLILAIASLTLLLLGGATDPGDGSAATGRPRPRLIHGGRAPTREPAARPRSRLGGTVDSRVANA